MVKEVPHELDESRAASIHHQHPCALGRGTMIYALIQEIVGAYAGSPHVEADWLVGTSRTAGVMILMVPLFTGWGAFAFYRCSDRIVRRYLAIADALMVCWMVLVLVRYLAWNLAFTEFAWYSAYVPMIFLPLLTLCGVVRSAAFDRLPVVRRCEKIAVGVSALLLGVVATNGWHGWVFRPDPDGQHFPTSYLYGPLYWVVVGWIVLLFVLAGCVLFLSARRQLHRAIFLLVFVIVFGFIIGVLYVQRVEVVFSTNISLVYALLFIVATELSLQLGLLPSLSWSRAAFTSLPLDLRVVSTDGDDVARTGHRPPLSRDEIVAMWETLSSFSDSASTVLGRDVAYEVFTVPGGYGLLTTDVTMVRRQKAILEEKQATLRRQNALLERDREIRTRLGVLQHERQFLEEVESGLKTTAEEIQALLNSLPSTTETAHHERTAILQRVKMLVSYSKAKGRLVLAEHESPFLAPETLELLVAQSAADFRSIGVDCALAVDLHRDIPTRLAALYLIASLALPWNLVLALIRRC